LPRYLFCHLAHYFLADPVAVIRCHIDRDVHLHLRISHSSQSGIGFLSMLMPLIGRQLALFKSAATSTQGNIRVARQ
jgi:hypothetical protein